MKLTLMTFMLCLLVSISHADFEVKDPASAEAAEAAEAKMRSIGKLPGNYSGDSIRLSKSDYLKLIVGNHVHGFKSFDTLVNTGEDSVFVVVFCDQDETEKARAEQFAGYLRKELPVILGKPEYKWARDVELTVAVYAEDRY